MSSAYMDCPSFRWIIVLVFVSVAVTGCRDVPAQDSGGPLLPEQAAYDVLHYDLDVRVHPADQRLEGRVRVRAAVRDSLAWFVLNLDHRLDVEDARLVRSGATLGVERRASGNELWIDLPETRVAGDTVSVSVRYSGEPRVAPNPPWEGGFTWTKTPSDDPWVATSGQTAGADLWWPVKDHPSDEPDSMDISITVPDSLVAASNGVLRTVERPSDSTSTYHWHVSTSINTYAVTLNVGPYVSVDTTYTSTAGSPVPVTFYALPSDSANARQVLPHFLEQVRFLEKTLGPYPFRSDKYGIAQTPFLGMEHQTLIAYGHDFSRSGGLGYDASFDALHFHELAHEWYGNCVTVEDWKDFWLHEGTATYLEALYAESLHGEEGYHRLIDYFRRQLDNRAPIAREEPTTAQEIYSRDIYYKGALVLHTLRSTIGKAQLIDLLRQFVGGGQDTEACRHVDTQDFFSLAESLTDRSYDAFAETYLYQAALPRLDSTRADGQLKLSWKGAHDGFEVPVPFVINGDERIVQMDAGQGDVAVQSSMHVQIDPKGWVLKAR